MIGTFAIYGEDIFFSEVLPKNNLLPCDYPIENWFEKESSSIFIPMTTTSITAPRFHDSGPGELLPTNHNYPRTCGLTIHPTRVITELAVHNEKLVWRAVPWGPGVIYTRSVYDEFEKAIYAAIKLTGNLRKAIELVDANSSVLCTGHIFTTISIVAYAAHMKDPGLIRTTSNEDMQLIVADELSKQYAKDNEDE